MEMSPARKRSKNSKNEKNKNHKQTFYQKIHQGIA